MAFLVSTLYEKNLFYQQLNFKWNCLIHLITVVKNVSSRFSLSLKKRLMLGAAVLLIYLSDVVCGLVIMVLVHHHPVLKQWLLSLISGYTLTSLYWTQLAIDWFMGVPGGLKLNTPLNHFLGTRLLGILDLWKYFYKDIIEMYMDSIVIGFLLLLPFGITVFLTALHDFLKFLHLCLICFFIFTSRTVTLQVSALKSLARLFMGTKWNVLRKRIDSCDYDTSQLLVGTILFTILLFLLPTTGLYFILFLLSRILQFGIQFILRMTAVIINNVILGGSFYICSFIMNEPLTNLQVLVNLQEHLQGSEEQIQYAKVQLMLNGKEYKVKEIQSMIESTPVECILKNVKKEGRFGSYFLNEDQRLRHPMLEFNLL